VVRRSKEQKAHSGERLNMDNQQLTACPRLVEEEKLRLLNYQSNSIRQIQNLDGTTKPATSPLASAVAWMLASGRRRCSVRVYAFCDRAA